MQPLWTKARYTPVGECVCQHLSQYADWTLQSRLPTNLTDKQCHPQLSNILGGKRGHTVQNASPHPVLAPPPRCYDARSLCDRLMFLGVCSILGKNTNTGKTPPNGSWVQASPANVEQSVLQSNCVGVSFGVLFWQSPPLSTPWLFRSASCNLISLPFKFKVLIQCQVKELQICHALPPAWCSIIQISPLLWYLGNK